MYSYFFTLAMAATGRGGKRWQSGVCAGAGGKEARRKGVLSRAKERRSPERKPRVKIDQHKPTNQIFGLTKFQP